MWVCRLGRCCSTTFSSCFSAHLEQRVFGRKDSARWTNSMACSFLWFKSHRFLYPETSQVYCLCCRTQWRPGLATVNTEWIWDHSYDPRNCPTSQSIAEQTCNVLRWGSRCRHFEHLISFSWGRNSENVLQKAWVYRTLLHVLWCLGLATHFSITLYTRIFWNKPASDNL
jgi:hypothetical protein